MARPYRILELAARRSLHFLHNISLCEIYKFSGSLMRRGDVTTAETGQSSSLDPTALPVQDNMLAKETWLFSL